MEDIEKNFYIIENDSNAEVKIKNSVFISHLHHSENIEEAKAFISKISTDYKDATHNCWAYIIGKNAEIFHSSDSGEPAGTAGKPILNTLMKHNLTNISAVVTRYYGGVKLGVRGLIDAYSESTDNAVKASNPVKLVSMSYFIAEVSYDFWESLKHKVKNTGGEIYSVEFAEKVNFNIKIEESKKIELLGYLLELKNRGKIDFTEIEKEN